MIVTRHKLIPGEALYFNASNKETFIHPLVGRGEAMGRPIGGRSNVFSDFPGGLLTCESFTIVAETHFDVLVASAECALPLAETMFVGQKRHRIGSGTARREVREILGHGGPASALRCGETLNIPGGWSSWPPHAFDEDATIKGFEEVFYVFTNPKDGYAVIRKNGVLEELRSGDRTDVPLGDHPIVAAPGVRLMYVWFYVGADKQYAKWSEDLGGYK